MGVPSNRDWSCRFDILATAFATLTFPSPLTRSTGTHLNNAIGFSVVLLDDYSYLGAFGMDDCVVWRNGLGTTYSLSNYNLWRTHFDQTAGSGSGAKRMPPCPNRQRCCR